MAVVVGEVIPVVRRAPVGVGRTAEAVEQRRTLVIDRLDDIVSTIDVGRTYHLNVRRRIAHLHDQCGYILIDVSRQHGLDKQDVVIALDGLEHAQVIDVAVAVEVEVGDDVGVGVQDHLKLLDAVSLGKSRSHGLEVKIQTDVLRKGRNIYNSCTRVARARVRDSGADRCGAHDSGLRHYGRLRHYHLCGRLSDRDRCRLGHISHDTCYSTACQ